MLRITQIKLPLDHSKEDLNQAVAKKLEIKPEDILELQVFKRSPDARNKKSISFIYSIDVKVTDEEKVLENFNKDPQVRVATKMDYQFVAHASGKLEERPLVIGTGPAGLFSGLLLAQMGLRPIILERGKKVRDRTVDTFGFWRKRILNEESNVQFGEGGAGTFSDGKLYTQIKDKKHYGRKVMNEFVLAGANPEILTVSKPHIGTFRLVKIVEKMRETIESLGGEFHFQKRVDDIKIENGEVRGLRLSNGEDILGRHIVLAVGHSARDTFQMLFDRGVYMEAKPFSIGFRIEHPQTLIDRCQYGKHSRNPMLGAADYKLVHHCKNGRSVYSFCMCPGGTVVAAASEKGRVVTNGMSQYDRSERNANSGIVVGITPKDFPDDSPLAGVALQRYWEEKAFFAGGENYDAPGQLIGDFIANRPSVSWGKVKASYTPGVRLGDLSQCMPDYVIDAIREALPVFDKQINGFAMAEALLTGVETRTSSPIHIKRKENFQSNNVKGLYPTGEGAGYAGGILSSAIDGIKVAEAVATDMLAE